jgi:alpha-tubulin suppressor-like RCC1 family protein
MTINITKTNAVTELTSLISGLTVGTATTQQLTGILKIASIAGVDASAIKTELTTRIQAVTSGTEIYELAVLSASLPLITDHRVISVADLTALTALSVQAGTIYYVDSELAPYIYKSTGSWVRLYPLLQGTLPIVNAYAWGGGTYGKLGDNTTVSKSSPVSVVGGFTDWVQVEAGGSHTLAIRANGLAYAWGSNSFGQLGNNTAVSSSSPVSVVGGYTDWVQLSAGKVHSLGIRANGTAWAWGNNSRGGLGDNTTVDKSSPVSVVGGYTDWIQVSGGNKHSLGVRANGIAWAWGYNNMGQLGDNTVTSKSSPVSIVGGFTDWVQLSAGSYHSLGVRSNGTAWAWGNNSPGRLGDNTTVDKSSPVSVVGGFTDWVQVSAGYSSSKGLRANGTAWAWGGGTFGKLGDNTAVDKSSPVSVVGGFTDWVQLGGGSDHSIGLRANGTAWAWGFAGSGRLGDNTAVNKSSPVSVVGGFTDWVQVSSGQYGAHSTGIRGG